MFDADCRCLADLLAHVVGAVVVAVFVVVVVVVVVVVAGVAVVVVAVPFKNAYPRSWY